MAYSELIKNFERIRDYMREFYVYGFKSRDEFTKKSARSYDDERRRVESWLGDYMRFRQTADGKKVFLSIDSRISHHNPFYKAWKAKSFTDGDITLHFLIFDVLSGPDIALPLSGIMDEIDRRLSCFDEPKTFDASTVRKKLKEYAEQGLICTDRSAKTLLYRRAATAQPACTDALDFFSEVAPCGVIGSFLLDKANSHEEHFVFKHHYITGALDSEILYRLFEAMHRKQSVQIETDRSAKTLLYRRAATAQPACTDALDFFSEVAPCGVIGSFLLDKANSHEEHFVFKHHYITGALDSEILYRLFEAMHRKQSVQIETVNRRRERTAAQKVVPLRIFISVQNGRQYLMAYAPRNKRIGSIRLDNILSVQTAGNCESYDTYRQKLDQMQKHIWGVSTEGGCARLEQVEFTVRYDDGEAYIHRRLEREKRCGQVERVDAHTSRFSADVYDAGELVPWIRTFICRIVSIHFSNQELAAQFKRDIDAMARLYGLNGGDEA